MNECVRIIVQGRVQGVAFRAHTQKQAQILGISGYVRNLPNGDVEILAQGEIQAVQQLVAWCHRGPMLAEVKQVQVYPGAADSLPGFFEIR